MRDTPRRSKSLPQQNFHKPSDVSFLLTASIPFFPSHHRLHALNSPPRETNPLNPSSQVPRQKRPSKHVHRNPLRDRKGASLRVRQRAFLRVDRYQEQGHRPKVRRLAVRPAEGPSRQRSRPLRGKPHPQTPLPLVQNRHLPGQHHHRRGLRQVRRAVVRPARAFRPDPDPVAHRHVRGQPHRVQAQEHVHRQGRQERADDGEHRADRGRRRRQDRQGQRQVGQRAARGRLFAGAAEAECCYGAYVGQGSQDGGGGPEDEGREGEEDPVKCMMCHC